MADSNLAMMAMAEGVEWKSVGCCLGIRSATVWDKSKLGLFTSYLSATFRRSQLLGKSLHASSFSAHHRHDIRMSGPKAMKSALSARSPFLETPLPKGLQRTRAGEANDWSPN